MRRVKKIFIKTEYWFYLFVFLLPWQTVFLLREVFIDGEKWQSETIGIYLSDIALIILLTLALFNWFKTQNLKLPSSLNLGKNTQDRDLKLKIKKPIFSLVVCRKLPAACLPLLAAFYILLSVFSALYSPDKLLALYFSLKLLLAIGLFFAIQKISFNYKIFLFIFLLGAVLQSGLGFWQFNQQESFSDKSLGISQHQAEQGGASVIENESGRWLRAYGGMTHPNILGGYLTLAFIAGLLFYLFYSNPRISYHQSRITNLKSLSTILNFKFTILNFLIIILPGILFSFSRNAWLAGIAGIFLLSISLFFKEGPSSIFIRNYLKILAVFAIIALIFTSFYSNLFLTRFDFGQRLEQKSIGERSAQIDQVKKLIQENFWLGVGAGNYTYTLYHQDTEKKPIWQYQPAHNVFLLVWAELGIIGLILFILILSSIFIKSGSSSIILLFSLFILLFFDHWLWTSHFGLILFWLILGLVFKNHEKIQPEKIA